MLRYPSTALLLAALLALGTAAMADPPEVIWETLLPGYELPHAHDVAVDVDGNTFLIGSAYEDGTHLDVLVAGYDVLGNVSWTRYITSSDHVYAADLALDPAGDVWVTGWTDAPDEFPLVDPMDDTPNGFRDIFLMKLSAADGSILYSTLLGGDYTDMASAIEIGAGGEIYLAGSTGSTDFPTTPDAWQTEQSFPLYFYTDAFVTKLSPAGDEILYSTYFGGTQDDSAAELALDSAGNMILVGSSAADDFPLVDEIQSDPNSIFISELSADGSSLLFSTWFGGEDFDRVGGIAIDDEDMIYLVGSTRSVSFPVTAGAYQEEFVGGIDACEIPFGGDYNCEDFFVTKLDLGAGELAWSSYLGGYNVDMARGVAVDDAGRVHVIGYTTSADFPMDPSDPLTARVVVSRFSADGSVLDYTYSIESGSANRGGGIAIDPAGDIIFSGTVGAPAEIYLSKLEGDNATAVGDGVVTGPAGLALGPNFPNPFNPTTTISYALPEGSAQRVRLSVYDAGGRLVRTLVDEVQAGGSHSVTWRGRDDRGAAVTSGVYFYRLQAGEHGLAKSMVLVR